MSFNGYGNTKMNIRITTLTILSIVAAGLQLQPANAQEGGGNPGARFHYAPNVYGSEKAHTPQQKYYNGPVAGVHSGSMPKGSFLIDPQLLAKPPAPVAPIVAPIAQTTVAATPRFTQVVPKFIPQSFNSAFGQPVSPPVVAQVPSLPQPLTPPPMQALKSPPANKPSVHATTNTHIAWNHQHKHSPVGLSAGPMQVAKPIASYGPGAAYKSGTYVPPSSSSGGMSSSGEVSGRILNYKRH